MRQLCIIDTNIIIDLEHGNLLSHFFRLPFTVLACELIQKESLSVPLDKLKQLGVKLCPATDEKLVEIASIKGKNRGLSIVDISSVLLARDTNSLLLSGDKLLVSYAKNIHVVTHGIIWVLDEMIKHQILLSTDASRSLLLITKNGARLPQKTVAQRLKSWQ